MQAINYFRKALKWKLKLNELHVGYTDEKTCKSNVLKTFRLVTFQAAAITDYESKIHG